ncbi:hypothetical protein A5682_14250 [Mycobacterium mantenii]|nr:hypothetical protein A5682_14250 [Mycobacterium mantenii]
MQTAGRDARRLSRDLRRSGNRIVRTTGRSTRRRRFMWTARNAGSRSLGRGRAWCGRRRVRRARRAIGRTRCRLDRRFDRLAGWQCHRTATRGRLDIGQILGDAFEVLGQVAARLGDAGEDITGTRDLPESSGRFLAGATCRTGCLRAACCRASTVGRRAGFTGTGYKQRCEVEQVLARSQSRASFTPIFNVQQGFDLLQLCVPGLLGVENGVEQTSFPHVFRQSRPSGGIPLWIDRAPHREKVAHADPHADSALEDTLVHVQPRVEDGRHLISDRITEKVFELASRVLFELDHQPVDDLHS